MKHSITPYKNFNFTEKFEETLIESDFEVEFVGRKARIHALAFFRPVKSRLNKVHKVGGAGKVNFYHIIASGKDVFFKSEHNIYKTK